MTPYSYEIATSRNRGIVSEAVQRALADAVIAVAGCGGAGGAIAMELARLGVRRFRLADPDTVDVTNLNRQEGAYASTLGCLKTEALARLIRDVCPEAEVETWPEGIDQHSVADFLRGSGLVLEEIDFRKPGLTRLVHLSAHDLRLPLLTGIPVAWNAFSFFFDYRNPKQMSFDRYVGLGKSSPIPGELRSSDLSLTAYVPELPLYLDRRLIGDVLSEKVDIPCVRPAVSLVAAQTATLALFVLSGERRVDPVPRYYAAGDLFLKRSKRVRLLSRMLAKLVR